MSETRQRYDDEFKKNAVKLSYASSKTVKEIAGDLGISVSLLYRWRKKYTPEGEKTQFATMEEENRVNGHLKTRIFGQEKPTLLAIKNPHL